jgi:NADH dehydrogenase
MSVKINLPEEGKPRVVIVGGGFAGVTLAQKLSTKDFQVVLLDKNNYHQFQPLFYQVAMAGLEPSSIIFPFRKIFQKSGKYFRLAKVLEILPHKKAILTDRGLVNYDYLVLAMGATTSYFGNKEIQEKTIPMKSVKEAIKLRNRILEDYENALTCIDHRERQSYLNVVIVGGGPTGVELAGALAEMKKYILPKDYPELNTEIIEIFLIEGNSRLLKSMGQNSSHDALKYLENLGVKVMLNTRVESYNGNEVITKDEKKIHTKKVIWAAGIYGVSIDGLPKDDMSPSGRYLVNNYNQLEGEKDIFILGDLAQMKCEKYPNGHPQVAQVAIQQASLLATNLMRLSQSYQDCQPTEFTYNDLGSMATVGRHAAVAEIKGFYIKGTLAWYLWLVVHLKSILGVKNKVFVLINWIWNYLSYDQSLRLIIKTRK